MFPLKRITRTAFDKLIVIFINIRKNELTPFLAFAYVNLLLQLRNIIAFKIFSFKVYVSVITLTMNGLLEMTQ